MILHFIEIAHEHAQPDIGCCFGIPRHQLFFVVLKREIEGVLGVHIDQHQVCIRHRDLAEAQLGTTIRHIVPAVGGRRTC